MILPTYYWRSVCDSSQQFLQNALCLNLSIIRQIMSHSVVSKEYKLIPNSKTAFHFLFSNNIIDVKLYSIMIYDLVFNFTHYIVLTFDKGYRPKISYIFLLRGTVIFLVLFCIYPIVPYVLAFCAQFLLLMLRWWSLSLTYFFLAPSKLSKISGSSPFRSLDFTK